jgi:hypothetical protein
MLHPCQVAAPFQVLNARNDIAFFFVPFNGTLKRVDLAVKPANVNGAGDSVFDVKLNGTSIFGSPTARPKIVAGQAKGNVSGLTVAVNEGDIISFDAATIPTGGLQGPVMLQCLIDDNITAGLDSAAVLALAAGGDVGGTLGAMIVNAIKGRSFGGIPAVAGFFGDSFGGSSVDATLWDAYTGYGGNVTVQETGGQLQVNTATTGGGECGGVTSHAALDVTGKTITVKLVSQTAVATSAGLRVGICQPSTNPTPESQSFCGFWIGTGWYGQDGKIDLMFYHPSLGYTALTTGPTWDGTTPIWLRIHYNNSTGQYEFSYSTDNSTFSLIYSWTPHSSLAASSVYFRVFAGSHLASGSTNTALFDDVTSDIPLTDPLASKDGWAISWDEAHNQFTLVQILTRLIRAVDGNPSGAPAGHIANQLEIQYDRVNHRLNVWNDNTSHWDSVNLPDTF